MCVNRQPQPKSAGFNPRLNYFLSRRTTLVAKTARQHLHLPGVLLLQPVL